MSDRPTPERVRWTVELLDVLPDDAVLEVGCGPGAAVALVAARLTGGGVVTAIDRSALMVARARARNAAAIAAGRVRLARQSLAEAAEAAEAVDAGAGGAGGYAKVFAVNVNAFWREAAESGAALARLVRAGGRALLVYELPGAAQVARVEEALPAALEAAGFRVTDSLVLAAARRPRIAVVARLPADATRAV